MILTMKDHPQRILAIIFVACLLIFLAGLSLPRRVKGLLFSSDGLGYYMYTHSLIIDGDLDFRNEYAILRPGDKLVATPTGLIPNQYAIGVGLLWAPFFLVVHFILSMGNRIVGGIDTSGYSYPYQASICVGSIVYGYLGIVLMYKTIARFFINSALLAVILIWLATNVLYYMVAEPSMSHMVSLFAVSLLVYLWLRLRPVSRKRDWLILGLASGLVAIVRQPDATFMVLPVLDALLDTLKRRAGYSKLVINLVVFGAGFFAIFSIQMTAWLLLYGNPLFSGYFYDGTQGFQWLSPRIYDMLFSPWRGIFSLHPITIFAVAGLLMLAQTHRRLASLIAVGFAIQVYLIGAWATQGDSFGGRMFISSYPVLALGLAAFIEWCSLRKMAGAFSVVGMASIIWNGLFMIQYRFGYIPMGGTPYTIQQLTLGKVEMLADLANRAILILKRGGL